MGLDNLGQVHEAAQFFGGRGDLHSQNGVPRFGRGQQMADGTDSADPSGQTGHLPNRAALAKLLKSAKFRHVEAGPLNLTLIVQIDRDLGVSFDAGDRVDDDKTAHPKLLCWGVSCGSRPCSTASTTARMRSASGGQPTR